MQLIFNVFSPCLIFVSIGGISLHHMLQSWPIIIFPPIIVGLAYTVGFLICKSKWLVQCLNRSNPFFSF